VTNLVEARVVILVFTIPGCEACLEYKPRFIRAVQHYRQQVPALQHVPIFMYDANDPRCAEIATRLGVYNVPVTFVLRRPTGVARLEGGAPDSEIARLLGIAAREAATNH